MSQSPEMRASDVERDRVAAVLREHTAVGRLTMDEFNERLELLYKSKTRGELARLTADLPDVDLSRHQVAKVPEASVQKKQHAGMRAAWGAWAMASSINWAIWLIISVTSGDMVYPWPLWVMGPWGVILLVSSIFGGDDDKKKS
ncbi:DUF1707 SHOCT-like domain-containing protein [Nonomuraea indica]|uniref:DUF1707 domain-containing protein n=1 Tax=Nonomuraea indica TaxID=1581193 RepID=A0ABW8A4G5_9ACTN|nr:DUF1707 domain-containing protein [Nonomuraea indica]